MLAFSLRTDRSRLDTAQLAEEVEFEAASRHREAMLPWQMIGACMHLTWASFERASAAVACDVINLFGCRKAAVRLSRFAAS